MLRRQVIMPKRDRDRERAALAAEAFDGNGPMVQLRQFLNQRKADTRALMRASPGAGHAIKALEQLGYFVRRDAGSGIAHRELETPGRLAQAALDLALQGELERVRDQIEDDLFPHLAIHERGFAERG